VRVVGLEPTSLAAADFLTTIVFTTISVCGLDYIFTLSCDLGAWVSSLYGALLFSSSLGIAISIIC